ncbi:hypothetical protein JW879_08700 [candidate division WOR-3 bacterium]|nr:hypothetical protein [candidate division WOR-3 bacterium]
MLLSGGERHGWIFSPCAGYGFTKYTENLQFWSSPESYENIVKGGVSAGGRVGYAPNDQLMFILIGVSNIFPRTAYSEKVFLENSTGAFGISYYLREKHPSVFFDAGIGFANWMYVINPHDMTHGYSGGYLGFGGLLGVGYEFAHGWSVENRIFYNHFSFSRDNVGGTTNTFSYSFTLSYSFYGLWAKKDKEDKYGE